jgi:hypothetical protein
MQNRFRTKSLKPAGDAMHALGASAVVAVTLFLGDQLLNAIPPSTSMPSNGVAWNCVSLLPVRKSHAAASESVRCALRKEDG